MILFLWGEKIKMGRKKLRKEYPKISQHSFTDDGSAGIFGFHTHTHTHPPPGFRRTLDHVFNFPYSKILEAINYISLCVCVCVHTHLQRVFIYILHMHINIHIYTTYATIYIYIVYTHTCKLVQKWMKILKKENLNPSPKALQTLKTCGCSVRGGCGRSGPFC